LNKTIFEALALAARRYTPKVPDFGAIGKIEDFASETYAGESCELVSMTLRQRNAVSVTLGVPPKAESCNPIPLKQRQIPSKNGSRLPPFSINTTSKEQFSLKRLPSIRAIPHRVVSSWPPNAPQAPFHSIHWLRVPPTRATKTHGPPCNPLCLWMAGPVETNMAPVWFCLYQ
jgi:hypothetical protein